MAARVRCSGSKCARGTAFAHAIAPRITQPKFGYRAAGRFGLDTAAKLSVALAAPTIAKPRFA